MYQLRISSSIYFRILKTPLKCVTRKLQIVKTSELCNTDNMDSVQKKLLEEVCIVVDEADRPLGGKTKKECHLMENIRTGLLHRAFSVFLFNSKNELLLQRRSNAKITFPGCYTNSCCSHPLYLDSEMENIVGVKRAARRRMQIELGINSDLIHLEDFHYMTRILYTAISDGMWGEREIDYVLILQKDVEVKPNPNEVSDIFYISRDDLPELMESFTAQGRKITPWFKMIANNFLYSWWDNLHNLNPLKDHSVIHHIKDLA